MQFGLRFGLSSSTEVGNMETNFVFLRWTKLNSTHTDCGVYNF